MNIIITSKDNYNINMIIDNRGLLLNTQLSSNGLGKKSLKSSIDNSSVTSTEHKSIDLGFKHQNSNHNNQTANDDKNQSDETKKPSEINLPAKQKQMQKMMKKIIKN